jgi:hypothetical protein
VSVVRFGLGSLSIHCTATTIIVFLFLLTLQLQQRLGSQLPQLFQIHFGLQIAQKVGFAGLTASERVFGIAAASDDGPNLCHRKDTAFLQVLQGSDH